MNYSCTNCKWGPYSPLSDYCDTDRDGNCCYWPKQSEPIRESYRQQYYMPYAIVDRDGNVVGFVNKEIM